ncbi:Arabinosidase A [Hypoxylon crocopeplum]|nr:Arabinosidase A [Hypoxylon crocopeplum]
MLLFLTQLLFLLGLAKAIKITVSSSGGNVSSSTQYGLMHEEINHSGDGGLYAELIRNRAFQGSASLAPNPTAWSATNGALLSIKNDSTPLSEAIPNHLSVVIPNDSSGRVGFANSGWWGIDVQIQPYSGSFYVKGQYDGTFTISLQSLTKKETFAAVEIQSQCRDDEWIQHNFTLVPTQAATDIFNSFAITFDCLGVVGESLNFTLVSLFPPTYKNRSNGLRRDLVEALAELKPTFLRFPGGGNINGILEGSQYKWNQTIGPLKDRPGKDSVWGYYETDGLGLVEYMQLCDDLDLEPVLGLWSGLNYVSGPLSPDELEPYVRDALDQLEFLTGPTDTTYGALRASLGYTEPWSIKYVEIGNEDNLTGGLVSYEGYRLQIFYDDIKAKYPNITVLASASEYTMNLSISDVGGDFHRYETPDGFAGGANFARFDHAKHQTLIGEMACVYPNTPNGSAPSSFEMYSQYPFWIGSVAEAVFLLGAEHNSDRIIGATYAPLIANFNGKQWTPTLIAMDANPANTTRSTSYHVWRLLASHAAMEILPTTSDADIEPLYYIAGRDGDSGSFIFKAAVYNSTSDIPVSIAFDGVPEGMGAQLTVLTSEDPLASNVLGGPDVVNSKSSTLTAGPGGVFEFSLPDLSVAVLRTVG